MFELARRAVPAFGIAMLATVSVGCAPLTIINAASPSGHYSRSADLAYGPLPRQQFDLYRPKQSTGNEPIVIFIYGGGWKSGTKKDYEFAASSLTEAGFVVVIPDYRLYPAVRFPTFVQDVALAVASVMGHLEDWAVDPNAVFLMGHSAGAHIAALLALDARYLQAHGVSRSRLAGWIGLAGPYDFLPINAGYLLEVFPEADRADSQPIRFVSSEAPPALLIHGDDDDVVKVGNSRRLADALTQSGADVTLRTYAGQGHARIAIELAPPLDFVGRTLEDSVQFMRAHGARAPQ